MSMQTRNRPPIQQDARRPQPRPPTALPRSRGTHAVSLLSLASAATLFVLTLLAAATPTHALATRMGVHDLRTLDADWAAELAGFPADARDAAYVVAGQPETLMRVAEIQQDSVQAFRALVEPLPREDQETVWDLVRHPGLVADLARDGRKSDAQLDALASQYPDESHAGILAAGGRLYPTWVRIHALDLDVERQLDTLLADQSVAYRDAFDVVTARPELVGLLVDDLEATTLLGAIQRENPEAVDTFFATLHDEVVARRAEEDRAWSAALEDPETAEEARAAARAFAADYGYAYDDATWARTRARSTTVVNVSISPFPFWFGYPTWYDVAYWYPASVWGYAGFYYGPSYASFYYAPRPSALFFGWYTRHTGHHHRYAPPRYAYRSHHAPRYTHRGPTPTTRGFRSGYRTASNHVDFLRARARQASYEPVRHRRVENRSRFEQRAPGADGRHGWDWRDRRGDTGRDRPDGRRDDRSRSSTDGRRDDRDHSSFDGRRDDRGGADFDGRRDDRRGRGGSPSARDSDRSRDRSRGHLSDFVTQSERRSRDGSSSTPRNRSETPRAERDRSGRGSAPPAVDTRSGGDERRSRRGGDGQVDSMRRSRGGDGQADSMRRPRGGDGQADSMRRSRGGDGQVDSMRRSHGGDDGSRGPVARAPRNDGGRSKLERTPGNGGGTPKMERAPRNGGGAPKVQRAPRNDGGPRVARAPGNGGGGGPRVARSAGNHGGGQRIARAASGNGGGSGKARGSNGNGGGPGRSGRGDRGGR